MAHVGCEPWPLSSQESTLTRQPGQLMNRLQSALINHICLQRISITLCLYIQRIAFRLFPNQRFYQQFSLDHKDWLILKTYIKKL